MVVVGYRRNNNCFNVLGILLRFSTHTQNGYKIFLFNTNPHICTYIKLHTRGFAYAPDLELESKFPKHQIYFKYINVSLKACLDSINYFQHIILCFWFFKYFDLITYCYHYYAKLVHKPIPFFCTL